MKLLVAFFAMSLGIAAPCFAMQPPQEPESQIFITNPIEFPDKPVRQILLYDGDSCDGNVQVGYIIYSPIKSNPTAWSLDIFQVAQDYRQSGLGLALFKKCIEDIKSLGGVRLEWTAFPLDMNIPLEPLITIYKKIIIGQLNFHPDSLFIGATEGSGITKQAKMRLQLT